MKIVLKRDVHNLGEEGDIRNVADGYARNFLIPKKLAVVYGRAALNELSKRAHHIEKFKEEKRQKSFDDLQKIEAMALVISVVAGGSGKIFGSITAIVIVQELARQGIVVEKKKVELPMRSIKMLGNYAVKIRVYENKIANLRLSIIGQEKDQGSET